MVSEMHFLGTWAQFARYKVENNKLKGAEGETEVMRDD